MGKSGLSADVLFCLTTKTWKTEDSRPTLWLAISGLLSSPPPDFHSHEILSHTYRVMSRSLDGLPPYY